MKNEVDHVPVFQSLNDAYIDIDNSIREKHEPRYRNVTSEFVKTYRERPQFFVRAPGRVSLMGGHADYCGYSVVAAALEQDFVMAVSIVEEG
jgi:galactokinase